MVVTLWLWMVDSLLDDSDDTFFHLSLLSMRQTLSDAMRQAKELDRALEDLVLEYRSGCSSSSSSHASEACDEVNSSSLHGTGERPLSAKILSCSSSSVDSSAPAGLAWFGGKYEFCQSLLLSSSEKETPGPAPRRSPL